MRHGVKFGCPDQIFGYHFKELSLLFGDLSHGFGFLPGKAVPSRHTATRDRHLRQRVDEPAIRWEADHRVFSFIEIRICCNLSSQNHSTHFDFKKGRIAKITSRPFPQPGGIAQRSLPNGESTMPVPATLPLMRFISPKNWATNRFEGRE